MKLKKEEVWIIFVLLLFFIIGLIFDKNIVLFISGLRTNFLNDFFIWASYIGTWFVVLFIMTSLFLWNERKRKWILPLWISLGLAEGVSHALKLVIGRLRPYEVLGAGNLAGAIGSSFPSAHAAAVFSSLAVLDKEFRKLKWIWLGIALLVAFSRIYLGVHYLSDVAFGALVGLGSGLVAVFFWEKKIGKNHR